MILSVRLPFATACQGLLDVPHNRQDLLVGEVYRQAHLRRMPAPLAKLSIQSLFKRADPPWIGPALLLVREGLLVSLVLGR